MKADEIKDFLDFKTEQYNRPSFIESDPISIPHQFELKEDIEIASFLTATISWGNRAAILKAANQLMEEMGNSPYDFVLEAKEKQLKKLEGFYYRTFNGIDLIYFIRALKHIYQKHGGLEKIFTRFAKEHTILESIGLFRETFLSLEHPYRTRKHISDPLTGSAAKRLNMMLRWLVRKDNKGVDFGIWKGISPATLSIPLDLHSGNTARKLGILTRKQNDAKAVMELDEMLRSFDAADPVKYDFALFGLGVFEKF